MALLKALPGAPDFKALPGSAKINGEPVKDNQPIKTIIQKAFKAKGIS